MVKNTRIGNDSLQLNSTHTWVPLRFFLIFLSLPNTGILGITGLMAMTLLRDYFIFNYLLIVLRSTSALQSSIEAFFISFLKLFLHPDKLRNCKKYYYVNGWMSN
jgi:hypothetical protein